MIYRFVHPVRAALWMPLVLFTAVTSSDCLRPLLLVIKFYSEAPVNVLIVTEP